MRTSNVHIDRFRLRLALLALLALSCVAAGPPILNSGDLQPLRLTPSQIRAISEIDSGPDIAARAAVLIDSPLTTSPRDKNEATSLLMPGATKLWGKNEATSLPMASTTKLMTALVALQSLTPAQIITVPGAALIGNASMGLQAGEQVSVETLLYGALLPSGNDAAMTLALAAAGSVDAFVARMNETAKAWGLDQTQFRNPHGLDEPGHFSSALDLAALAQRALASPQLAPIVATAQASVNGYVLTNTNELLSTYAGADGVKTGTTDEAGQVLVASATRKQGRPISVVLDSPDRFRESARLLDFYFDHWIWLDPRLQSDALNRVTGPDGQRYDLRTASQPLFLPRWQADHVRDFRLISFDAANQPSGLYQVWLGEQKLLETPITFVAQPDL